MPVQLFQIPEEERERRAVLGTDDCVIDDKWFFVRGCLEIPVHGESDPFIWGVWVSLSKENFEEYIEYFGAEKRSHLGPYFGWLAAEIWIYPGSMLNLKTSVHIRDKGIRPLIELEPSQHRLSIEQRNGISYERLEEIYEKMAHPENYA